MVTVGHDISSSQNFLAKFQACYSENVSLLVQSISAKSVYLSQELSKLENSAETSLTAEDYQSLRNVLEPLKKTMSAANDSLSKFCPTNFTVKLCSNVIGSVNDKIDAILLLMSTKKCTSTLSTASGVPNAMSASIVSEIPTTLKTPSSNGISSSSTSPATNISPFQNGASSPFPSSIFVASTLAPGTAKTSKSCDEYSDEKRFSLITYLMSEALLKISKVLSCMSDYTDLLKAFQSFLDSIDRAVSTVDTSGASRSMNTLLSDASCLETLMVSYQNGSLTKLQLSNGFLQVSNSRLLLHVDNALSGIETSVLSDMTSIINAIETRTISVYSQLVMYLYKLQTFMSYNDTAVDSFARELVLWRSPIPMLQDKTVCLADSIFSYTSSCLSIRQLYSPFKISSVMSAVQRASITGENSTVTDRQTSPHNQ